LFELFQGSVLLKVIEIRSVKGKERIFLCTAFRPSLGLTQPPIHWMPGALSPGVELSGRVSDNSPPTSGEVNAWSNTSTPPIRVHAMVLR